eukprot:22140-Rhodomonas_salina.1
MRLCRMRDSSERVCERGRGGGNAKVGGSAGGDSHGRSGPRPSHICTVTPKHFIERGDQLLGLCFYMPSRTRKKRTEKSPSAAFLSDEVERNPNSTPPRLPADRHLHHVRNEGKMHSYDGSCPISLTKLGLHLETLRNIESRETPVHLFVWGEHANHPQLQESTHDDVDSCDKIIS